MTGRTMSGRREGFTLIELLIVVLVVGILSVIVMPNLNRALTKARAAEVLGDLNVVKQAALSYQADNTVWPTDVNRGNVPPGLEPYLPDGFSFTTEEYVLDYDNWSESVGLIGVTMITDNRELGLALLDMAGGNSWTNGTDKYTWVFEWTD